MKCNIESDKKIELENEVENMLWLTQVSILSTTVYLKITGL